MLWAFILKCVEVFARCGQIHSFIPLSDTDIMADTDSWGENFCKLHRYFSFLSVRIHINMFPRINCHHKARMSWSNLSKRSVVFQMLIVSSPRSPSKRRQFMTNGRARMKTTTWKLVTNALFVVHKYKKMIISLTMKKVSMFHEVTVRWL